MRKILLLILVSLISACSGIKSGSFSNTGVNANNTTINTENDSEKSRYNLTRSEFYTSGKEKLSKYDAIVKKLMEEKEKKEDEFEDVLNDLDLSYCDKIQDKYYQDKCKLRIVFSSKNKKGCNLIKSDKNLFVKCLKIKQAIQEYKKILQYKYYYDEYYYGN